METLEQTTTGGRSISMKWPNNIFTVATAADYNNVSKITAKIKITEAISANVLKPVGFLKGAGKGRPAVQYQMVD